MFKYLSSAWHAQKAESRQVDIAAALYMAAHKPTHTQGRRDFHAASKSYAFIDHEPEHDVHAIEHARFEIRSMRARGLSFASINALHSPVIEIAAPMSAPAQA